MKNKYTKHIGKSDNVNFGTFVIQTSGNAPLSGESVLVQDYSLHSYHIYPSGGNIEGGLDIQVSNDEIHWVDYKQYVFKNSGEAQIADSSQWHFKYARPIISGQGNYVINESHLA